MTAAGLAEKAMPLAAIQSIVHSISPLLASYCTAQKRS
jgi:hypothetical protein